MIVEYIGQGLYDHDSQKHGESYMFRYKGFCIYKNHSLCSIRCRKMVS